MLRLIAGFERPDAGRILIAGHDMTGKRPYERNVGLFFQHYALFPHMTVEQNVAYGLHHRRFPKPEIRGRVGEMLELVRLSKQATRRPGQLSGGQQQRVALARALATHPEVVLLDEPLSALDAKLRLELRAEIKSILRVVGSTTIIVTHDQEEAMGLAERVIIMHEGRLLQEGTPDQIYSSPSNRFVAEFVGRSNWFEGRLIEATSDHGFCKMITESGLTLTIPIPTSIKSNELIICVRPERIDFAGSDLQNAAVRRNVLRGEVLDSAILGPEIHIRVALSSGDVMTVVAQNRIGNQVRLGGLVTLTFDADQCIIFPK
jgi:putative spermidine/putrescine transport system ATP-binding protein/putrescine transport system ATP-binding protein